MEIRKQSEIQLQKETLRIETFSDGVFCIAVTLLSIEIGVEIHGEVTNKGLQDALQQVSQERRNLGMPFGGNAMPKSTTQTAIRWTCLLHSNGA